MKRIGMIQLIVEHHEISEAVYTSFRRFPVRRCDQNDTATNNATCVPRHVAMSPCRQADDAEVEASEASEAQRMVLFQRSGLLPEDLGADGAALE